MTENKMDPAVVQSVPASQQVEGSVVSASTVANHPADAVIVNEGVTQTQGEVVQVQPAVPADTTNLPVQNVVPVQDVVQR